MKARTSRRILLFPFELISPHPYREVPWQTERQIRLQILDEKVFWIYRIRRVDRRTKSSALYEDDHLTFRCVWARTHHVEKGQGFKKYMIGQHIIALFIINKTEALSIRIPFHLQKQLFHYGYDFRPHVSEENAHENFSKTFSRVELFQNAVWTDGNGTFQKRWGHIISSNPLRAILETFSRWRTGVSLFVFYTWAYF